MADNHDIFLILEIAVFFIVLFLFAAGTLQRNKVWKNYYTLWTDVVNKSPDKARPHNYLGLAYKERNNLESAIEEYRIALDLNPFYANAHSNLGICYFEKGLINEAISEFKHAIRINPRHKNARYNLGIAYGEKGMIKEAFKEMRKAKELGAKF